MPTPLLQRAEDGTRTRDPDLGKVVLYQLSYFRNNTFNERGCKYTYMWVFYNSAINKYPARLFKIPEHHDRTIAIYQPEFSLIYFYVILSPA